MYEVYCMCLCAQICIKHFSKVKGEKFDTISLFFVALFFHTGMFNSGFF